MTATESRTCDPPTTHRYEYRGSVRVCWRCGHLFPQDEVKAASPEAEGLDVEAVRLLVDDALQYGIAFLNDPEGLASSREEWRDLLRSALHAFRAATPPTSGSHEPEGLPAAPAALDVDRLLKAARIMSHEDTDYLQPAITIPELEEILARLSSPEASDDAG